jgi:hypothetical protein
MNAVSSRSHAIFTVNIEQNHHISASGDAENSDPNHTHVRAAKGGLEAVATGIVQVAAAVARDVFMP